jgi:pimeloyl-ACP methyl ester carboxylesterase
MDTYTNPYEHLSGLVHVRSARRAGFTERRFDTTGEGERAGGRGPGRIGINYVVGPDNGPPLVLIPAQTGTWDSYQRVLVPLSRRFQVYAVDVRGHGKSTWTPGDYSWATIGEDMAAFLRGVVGPGAIISGNSSGGIIALWCAVNVADHVAGVILEDAPVFSVEMPRFRDRDRFVYRGLEHAVRVLGDLQRRDLADYLRQRVPVSETRERTAPEWFVSFVSRRVRAFQARHPDRPVDIWYFPRPLRVLLRSLSMFDPDFARAFVDGRMYDDLDHADTLRRITCPLLVLHADWHRSERYGLVGAMDDDDAARIRQLAPHARYRRIPANHVIHMFKPREFVAAVDDFARSLQHTARAGTGWTG